MGNVVLNQTQCFGTLIGPAVIVIRVKYFDFRNLIISLPIFFNSGLKHSHFYEAFSLNAIFLIQLSHEERERRLKKATCSALSGPTRAPWFQCKFNSDKIIEPCEQATGNLFFEKYKSWSHWFCISNFIKILFVLIQRKFILIQLEIAFVRPNNSIQAMVVRSLKMLI